MLRSFLFARFDIYTAVIVFFSQVNLLFLFFHLNRVRVLQGQSTFFSFLFLSLPEEENKRMENVVPSFTTLVTSIIESGSMLFVFVVNHRLFIVLTWHWQKTLHLKWHAACNSQKTWTSSHKCFFKWKYWEYNLHHVDGGVWKP